jgi:hypothetical protein
VQAWHRACKRGTERDSEREERDSEREERDLEREERDSERASVAQSVSLHGENGTVIHLLMIHRN